ncbi:membrane fusion protein (multidrug efflux system) [Pseudaminobacter salicylatoxidans]|uniref:Membrane fusion protein (Multidrug efflux system) n=1 Tax=Pseudaminobacter salicylatoxidans TaxID=93369 RepID=A0A316C700_PSESE|nr:efflux RND transporter periplasmic adaptor subunit [Pseudaminobacter salicylatoxidans]PWJ85278.1 membrane fusion protein (multidrug efflux system) [Pseudaminobacter salicylatoxidans]
MIKRFIIAIIFLIIVCGGIVGFNLFRDRAIEQFFANMPVATLAVSSQTVEPITWTPGIEALGTVSASEGVDLTVEAPGIVKEILFSPNQQVKAGEVLVQLDDAAERADLAATRAQAALDQTTLDRASVLQKRGVGSEVTVDSARAAADASSSQVLKLQALLDQKQLRAPFSGTIGIRRVNIGQYLSPGTIVATLQDLDKLYVDFSVPEQQLDLLKIGGAVRFGVTTDNMPFTGKIIGIEPKVDPVSRLVRVRAEVADADGRLSPGQFIQAQVMLPEEKNVLALSQTAVVSSLYGDFVFVIRPPEAVNGEAAKETKAGGEGKAAEAEKKEPEAVGEPKLVARQVFVKTGRRSNGLVEILEGVSPGDVVVTAGQNRLSNNTPVSIDNTINPANPAKPEADAK